MSYEPSPPLPRVTVRSFRPMYASRPSRLTTNSRGGRSSTARRPILTFPLHSNEVTAPAKRTRLAGSLPGLFALWRTARTSTVSGVSQESLLPDVDSRALPPQVRKGLKEVGWTKGLELAKLARKAGRALRKCNLVAQGSSTAEGRLKREVEKELAGKDSEPSELVS